jgi:tetratricopeptide (TPR) repeat protein
VVRAPAAPVAVPASAAPIPGREAQTLRASEQQARRVPANRDAQMLLGRARLAVGKYAEAAGAFERHLELCKDCPVALAELGACRAALGERAAAVRAYQRLQGAHPARAEPGHRLAWLLVHGPEDQRDRDQALILARRAVALAPADAQAALTLGVVYYRRGEDEQAADTLKKVPAGPSPAASLARLFLAMTYHRLGRAEEARQAFASASPWWRSGNLHPHLVTVWDEARTEAAKLLDVPADWPATEADDRLARGQALARLGRWAEAVPDLDEVARQRPEDGAIAELAGRVHAHVQGHEDAAARHLARALALLGGRPAAEEAAARIANDAANWPEVFERLVRQRPDDHRLWLAHGRLLARRGQWKEALADYARLPADRPLGAETVERAALLLLQGDRAGYAALCTRAAKQVGEKPSLATLRWQAWLLGLSDRPVLEPGRLVGRLGTPRLAHPMVAHATALARYRAGQTDAAGEVLTAAALDERDDLAGLNGLLLALVRHRQGRAAEARSAWEKACRWLDAERPSAGAAAEMSALGWLTSQLLRREAESVFAVP